MKIAKIILAGTGALTLVASAALAQQMLTGTITKVDRINSSLAIRQTQSGTVGANSSGAAEEFKTQDGLSLEKLHAGDRVTFSATEKGWGQNHHQNPATVIRANPSSPATRGKDSCEQQSIA